MPNLIFDFTGKHPILKCQEEIDILIISDEKEAIFADCKWPGEPMGKEVLDNLIRKSNLFPLYEKKYYYLFSKTGFKKSLEEIALLNENIYLISLSDMYL